MPRSIVHLDADAFFASVEQAADPRLRGKPIAVGGEKRGIIASASYEARKMGIYTPMPTAIARRLCPKLILLAGDFEKYELFSRLMFSYAYDFTPDVEVGSIDEGYLDLTGVRKPAASVAETLRRAIRQSLKLSVSEGIASNKLVSQIASKLQKPAAFQAVPSGDEASFLAPLANKWLPGIGPKTAGQLNAAGLAHIGQIARTPPELLGLLVGNFAPQLRQFALGRDERPVVPVRADAKSYGEQETFEADTTDESYIEATLRRMADRLMAKVRADSKSARTLTVKVRYNDMDEQQASQSLPEPTDLETEIYYPVSALLRKAWQRRVSLRLVSLKLSNLYDNRFHAGLALDNQARKHDAQQRLADVVDELRHKFGRRVLLRGHDFTLGQGRARQEERPPIQLASALKEPATPYHVAVVQRQRLGSSAAMKMPPSQRSTDIPVCPSGDMAAGPKPAAAETRPIRVSVSPGPDLRFRVHLPPRGVEPGIPYPAASRPGLTPERASRVLTKCVPLNVHSFYSFLDSTLSIGAIVDFARENRLPAIALTDRNNLHGAVEFAQAAAEAGIKPIIGAELLCQGQRLCVFVQNQTGYRNLCRMLNRLAADSRAPTEVSTLADTEGLLALSPASSLARFFPGRFYLEIGSREAREQRPSDLPGAISYPVHYAVPGDRWKYDVVQSIRTLTLLRQQHPDKRFDGEYHFRSAMDLQPWVEAHPELILHTHELAERCEFEFTLGQPQFPSYSPTDGSTPAEMLRRLALEGLQHRYPKDHARMRPQVLEELAIITDVGYEEYFLVMWDILQECRRRGIDWITRGSAADSLVCYCLEISSVCPIRFDLYFRRFLNKERMALNKLPDIDVDFPHDRKDDVIDLIFEKYGSSHAAIVGGFSTFQARSAFAEVCKVLGVSDHQARRITERFPHFAHPDELAEAVGSLQECRDLPLDQEPYSTALAMGRFLDRFPRYAKMHPCGLVLSRQPMDELTPCFTSAKGYPTTHLDMDSVEAIGLIKMDILAQGGLAAMRDVKAMLRKATPPAPAGPSESQPPFNLDALEPWDDPEVWKLIADGGARAVHHIESPAMISLCKMCNVRDIDTLVAIVSVIRPGAANESHKMEFARRYQGLSPTLYPHPSLERCLRSTYGLVVYEEHILQICEAFAGLPPGRADILRRALGKEKLNIIAEIQGEFADCARRLGRSEADINSVWNLVTSFRGYAFCKAHSTAYGVEAYQSAWLKRYYPAEFMAAVLTNGKGFYHPLVYILECHRLGIRLRPPTINQPGPAFSVEAGSIRIPVLEIKGLSRRTQETILSERDRGPFSSLTDFFLRVQPVPEDMELLIRIGAFDTFGQSRTHQYWEFKARDAARTAPTAPASPAAPHSLPPRQLWLLPPGNLDRLDSVPLTDPSPLQRLRWEEELLGYPASGHPLELFPEVAWNTYCPVNRLGEFIGQQVTTCGLVIEQRLFHQVTGEPMKFLTLADWTGVIETELFARTYRSYGLTTVRYRVLEITATVEPFENNRGHTLRVLRAGKPRRRHQGTATSDRCPDQTAVNDLAARGNTVARPTP